MTYFMLAGEASGDLHTAALARALKEKDPDAKLYGWGGDEMEAEGVQILKHYRELAFMGFVEVLQHLPEIMRNFKLVKKQIAEIKPDALILTDYPGFNLRMAKWAHQKGIPVHYYISPQLWAWKESRVKQVRQFVDQMYVILPFEEAFYAKHGIKVHYVGHPLAWRIRGMEARRSGTQQSPLQSKKNKNKLIILLPGSRKREIAYMLPVMLEAVKDLKGYSIYIAGAPSVASGFYYKILQENKANDVSLTTGYTYHLLQQASAAICTSGTATLETALFNVPQVVCYKGDRISYHIAKKLVKIPYVAMVNLISGKEVVKELIQDDFNPASVRAELEELLKPERRTRMLSDYAELHAKLEAGDPAMKVATLLISSLKRN